MKLARLNGGAEIFLSIQGEGPNVGEERLFIRAALCNLQCTWCDSAYTWDWKKFDKTKEIIEMTPHEIAEIVQIFPCKNVVLTGGEPMLQQEELTILMETLQQIDKKYRFEVETNGTIRPLPSFDKLVCQYNVSPKLKNSGSEQALSPAFLKHPKALFKFVIVNREDLNEVLKFVEKSNIAKEKIFLMPEGITAETLTSKKDWMMEACKNMGFQFTDRLHIHRFGNERGT